MVDHIFPGAPTAVDTAPKRGTLNHLRLTVSDIPRAEAFYAPILDHMGFTLAERSDTRIAWGMLTAAGDLQWTVVGLAQDRDGRPPHDRYAPGFHHVAWNAQSRQDVDDMHALLVDRGAEVLDPPDGLKLEYVHIPTAGSAYFWQAFQDRGINPFDYNDAVVVED
jgi:catechol 2,3-dioxygenase-like lactoylglutathione lyase family enzyme